MSSSQEETRVPVISAQELSRSTKIKDILYLSKRFRNAQFGENVAELPAGSPIDA
jgi:hypothetical protein